MIYRADLHTHSTASDGQYAPTELVGLAKEAGIQVLALTDHDTLDGVKEAEQAGADLGITVIRGVELSAAEYRNLHILGYGYDPADPGLTGFCNTMKARRDERKYRLRDFLKGKGVHIDLAEVEELAQGGVVGRPHFAQVMVRRGYVANNKEAFDRYLDTGEYSQFAQKRFPARECVETLKKAGAKVSFAHPYQVKLDDGALEDLVKELNSYGLDAIECYYPKHTPEQQAFYLSLAEKYGLHVSGGSDFHGEKVKPDTQLARLELDLDWLLERGA